MIYLIFLLAIGLLVGWSLWKAPSDIDLWGKDLYVHLDEVYSENLTILAPEKHKYGAKSDKKG